MARIQPTISILIATKNRCDDLLFTLDKVLPLCNEHVHCVVYDDGSSDGTFERVQQQFPQVTLRRNHTSKGYLYCRNRMLNDTTADYAISLDDDAHFLSADPIENVVEYFAQSQRCGLIAFRIFWSKTDTDSLQSDEPIQNVKSFVGCGHSWRMAAWRDVPNYPEWFRFYGEENFAAFQLFKKRWEIHYVPDILIRHRVDLKERAQDAKSFALRYRRAIRADWYNYFLFLPWAEIPGKMAYSLWMQGRKVFRGGFKVVRPLVLALLDLFLAVPKLLKHRKALTPAEYKAYAKLNEAKIYWKPEK